MYRAILFIGFAVSACLLALGLVLLDLYGTGASAPSGASETGFQVERAYGTLPLHFEPNHGQTDPSVEFLAHGRGYTLYLTPAEAVLRPSSGDTAAVSMMFLGSNPDAQMNGFEKLPGRSNYFVGSRDKWRTEIPHFAKVEYLQIYPGIDLVLYGNQGHLEFDFVVAPAVDPGLIHLGFEGMESLIVNDDGNLVVQGAGGELIHHTPTIYQEINGARHMVSGGYLLEDSEAVRFSVGDYDPAHPLVIDPVLSYSTYLGSNISDTPYDIAVDSAGHAYITGTVEMTSFPTTGPIIGAAGYGEVVVTKLNVAGDGVIYSTFFGGPNGGELGLGIAVDEVGSAYVTGMTGSADDFPTLNASQPASGGLSDAFILKLNPAGSALVYSTFLGGNNSDSSQGIAVDRAGNAYVVGNTSSRNFPTLNALQPTYPGVRAGFVVKFGAAGGPVFSTLLGGSESDDLYDVAVDGDGNIFVTGRTTSDDFPTKNAFQGTRIGAAGRTAAFVTSFTPGGGLAYSTYLGGSDDEEGLGIAVSAQGLAYVTGFVESSDFPTAFAFDGTLGGGCSAFVTKLNADGDDALYSTYLGGSGGDCVANTDIALNSAGHAYITGGTGSLDFPTVRPVDGSLDGFTDAFVSCLDSAGGNLLYSTYLGGNADDNARYIAVDPEGNAYVLGKTMSADFPTVNPFQASQNNMDMFVSKLSGRLDFFIAATPAGNGRRRPGS